MSYNYNELIKFVDELVIYDIRWDVYKDKPVSLVANIAKAYTIQTIDKTDNIEHQLRMQHILKLTH